MNRRLNIFSPFLTFLLLALLIGCGASGTKVAIEEHEKSAEGRDSRGFDPLEFPRDQVVVPKENPHNGSIAGRQVLIASQPPDQNFDSVDVNLPVVETIDSVNSQAFRVQLVTSRVYGDAKRAAAIAEEIFDQLVYVDYEVPNYKVRVGGFANRDDAESYQQKAKTAGYKNAWVVMVNVGVKEVAHLYDETTDLLLTSPDITADSVITDSLLKQKSNNESDDDDTNN